MAPTYLTLTLDDYDGQGNVPSGGVATFTPTVPVTDIPDHMTVITAPVITAFKVTGTPVVKLRQTDYAADTPPGWGWGVSFTGVKGDPPGFSFFLPAAAVAFTATNAAPCVFTAATNPYQSGYAVVLAGGSLPAGFTAATTYWVVNSTGTTFQLAATPGGTPIASSSTGSGTLAAAAVQYLSALSPVSTAVTLVSYAQTPAGDLGGTSQAPILAKIQGTPIATPPGGSTSFLRGDGAWAVPAGGGGGGGITPPAGDIGGTAGTPTVASTHFPVTTISAATGTVNLDPTSVRAFKATLTGATTFTFNGTLAAGTVYGFDLYLAQDATGGRAVTWPGSVTWLGSGTAPTLPTTANAVTLLAFETVDGGTTWYGSAVTQAPPLPLPVPYGGSGASTAIAAFNVYSPMTTLGDLTYESSGTAARLPGNTTATKQFLAQTGTGSVSAAPAWAGIAAADLPAATTSLRGAVILDGTAADITPNGAPAAGASGLATDAAHVHGASTWVPSDNGLLLASDPIASCTTQSSIVNGTLYLVRLNCRYQTVITNLWWLLASTGATPTAGANWTGTYSSSGVLLTQVAADIGSTLTSGSAIPKSYAMSAPPTIASADFVWGGLLLNFTSPPKFWSLGANPAAHNLGLTPAFYRYCTNGTGLTTLPATITPASNSLAGAISFHCSAS